MRRFGQFVDQPGRRGKPHPSPLATCSHAQPRREVGFASACLANQQHRLVAARAATLGCLDALAVDHRGGRAGLTTGGLAVKDHEMVVQRLPDTAIAEGSQPAMDGRSGKQSGSIRQGTPPRRIKKIALRISRIGQHGGRRTGEGAGRSGSPTHIPPAFGDSL